MLNICFVCSKTSIFVVKYIQIGLIKEKNG